jgi:uncharacterized membrane protein YccC
MDADKYKKKSLKTMLYGWPIAAAGMIFTQYLNHPILLILGMLLLLIGGMLFLAGWILFLVATGATFLYFIKQSKADPKELYPPPKQPWER